MANYYDNYCMIYLKGDKSKYILPRVYNLNSLQTYFDRNFGLFEYIAQKSSSNPSESEEITVYFDFTKWISNDNICIGSAPAYIDVTQLPVSDGYITEIDKTQAINSYIGFAQPVDNTLHNRIQKVLSTFDGVTNNGDIFTIGNSTIGISVHFTISKLGLVNLVEYSYKTDQELDFSEYDIKLLINLGYEYTKYTTRYALGTTYISFDLSSIQYKLLENKINTLTLEVYYSRTGSLLSYPRLKLVRCE